MESIDPFGLMNHHNAQFFGEKFLKIKSALIDRDMSVFVKKGDGGDEITATKGLFHSFRAKLMSWISANITERGKEQIPISEAKEYLVQNVKEQLEKYRNELEGAKNRLSFTEKQLLGEESQLKELEKLKSIYSENMPLWIKYDALKATAESFQDSVEEVEEKFQREKEKFHAKMEEKNKAIDKISRLAAEMTGEEGDIPLEERLQRLYEYVESELQRTKGESSAAYLERVGKKAENYQALVDILSPLREGIESDGRNEIPLRSELISSLREKLLSIDECCLREIVKWGKRCDANKQRWEKKVESEKEKLFAKLQKTLKPLVDWHKHSHEESKEIHPLNDLAELATSFNSLFEKRAKEGNKPLEELYDKIVNGYLGSNLDVIIEKTEMLLEKGMKEEHRLENYLKIEEFANRIKKSDPRYDAMSLSEIKKRIEEELSAFAEEIDEEYLDRGEEEKRRLLSEAAKQKVKNLHSFVHDFSKKYSDSEIEEIFNKVDQQLNYIEAAKEAAGEEELEDSGVSHYYQQRKIDEIWQSLRDKLLIIHDRAPNKPLCQSIDKKVIEKIEHFEEQREKLEECEMKLKNRVEGKIALLDLSMEESLFHHAA